MTVYLSPSSGVNLLSSSLGTLYPIEDENGGDRVTYFIYYSHGADVGPWEFSLELVVCLLLWLHLQYKDMNKQNIPNTVAWSLAWDQALQLKKQKNIGKPSELSISLGRELEREKGRQSTARLASLTDYLMLFHSIFCYFSPKGEPGPCLVDY